MYGCVRGVRIVISSCYRWLNDRWHRRESEKVLLAFVSANLTLPEYLERPCKDCGHGLQSHRGGPELMCASKDCKCWGWDPGKK